MNRFLNTHRDAKSYGINREISIERIGVPGTGGAYSHYKVVCNSGTKGLRGRIDFHAKADAEPNGITNEVLLAIVADRLEHFQAGPFPCQENTNALNKIREAMIWLNQRQDRLEADKVAADKLERQAIEQPEPAE